jgi:hypothetical protein
MQNLTAEQQQFIRNLFAVAPKHCDNCGNKYEETDFKVVKAQPGIIVMHLKCRNCGNAYMLNVVNPANGMVGAQRTPMNVDIQADDEIQKFAGREAVTKNDALDIFSGLDTNANQENLKKLLEWQLKQTN